ncbi:mycofactocin system GMC family oxidoreductase MftG [Microbacterium sp. X-17]|uniref:mycofactocin dehydrogenase MftG n=1 Tax=Microbacterium sp. X-17 TaxID=3144404 RepID=UPI0031F49BAE
MNGFDVIVVGSGSSGGTLAARLSENPDRSVLLLEAGQVFRSAGEMPVELLEPSRISAAIPGEPTTWTFQAEMTPGRRVPYARGKVMGGSSTINACYFVRGTKQDFDTWARLGNDEWAFDRVLPVFTRLETDRDFAGPYHGASGPVQVSRQAGLAPEFASAFDASCRALGFADDPDKNAPDSRGGIGPLPMNIADGVRYGSAMAYLLPAMGRPNLRVVGGALVQKVLFDGQTAIGIQALVDGRLQNYYADEVVLSAGALNTPQVLMLSGVGPAEHLREHGIDVVHDLPGVGQGLSDHAMVGAAWESSARLSEDLTKGSVNPILHCAVEGGEIEIIPFVLTNEAMLGLGGNEGGTASIAVVMLQPESRGTVSLGSADATDLPVPRWNLLSAQADRVSLREGVRLAAEIFDQQALRGIGGRLSGFPEDLSDTAALDAWLDQNVAAGHPSSTCRMGPTSDPGAVVDQRLRVYGLDRLHIADASVFPTLTSRGPNATSFLVGERAAELLG